MKLAISRQLSVLRLRSGSKIIRLFVSLSLCLWVLLSPFPFPLSPSFAEVGIIGIKQPPTNAGVQVRDQSGGALVGVIIKNFITLIYAVGAVGVAIMFLWGATEWILSGGDKEKIATARKRITSSLIGLVLLALAFVILGVISQITGINVLGNITIPTLGKP